MVEMTLEVFVVTLLIALSVFMVAIGRGKVRSAQAGWRAIAIGFALLAVGAAIDAVDKFEPLNEFFALGGGWVAMLLKNVIGFFGGLVCLAFGLTQWMPSILRSSALLDQRTRELAAMKRRLESEIADKNRAVEELNDREQRFRDYARSAVDRYWETDENHRTVFLSEKEGDETKWPREFWFGKPRWEAHGVKFEPEILAQYRALLSARHPFRDIPFTVLDGNGETHYYRASGFPIFRQDGTFKGYRGTARRFDFEIEAERTLRATERKFRDLYMMTPAMMHSHNADGILIEVSNYWLDALGYSREEIVGRKSILDLVTDDTRARVVPENIRKVKETGSCREVPYQIVKKDGTIMEVLLSSVAVEDDDGNFLRSLTVMIDVTERNRAEAEALRAWERLHDAVETIDHGFCLWDEDDRLVLANSRYLDMFPEGRDIAKSGMTFEQTLRRLLNIGFLAVAPKDRETYIRERVAEHQQCLRNVQRQLPDGRWIRLSEFRTKRGEIVAIRTDITDLKNRQNELQANERRFKNFASASADRFWESDADDVVTYISEPTGRLWLPSEFICGKKIWTEDRPKTWTSAWEEVEEAMAAHKPFREFRSTEIQEDGSVLHAKMSGTPWHDDQGNFMGYRGGVTDATDEVEAILHAAAVQKKFLDAIEGITDSLVLWDADDKFVTCNSHYRNQAPKSVAEVLVPGTSYVEYLRRRAYGGEIAEALGREEEWVAGLLANRGHPVHETLANGRWYRVRCQRLDDGSTFEFHTDVTEAKAREAELERAKIGAETASRAKSEFLSSMSHEIRTPMNAILGFGQLLAEGRVPNEAARRRYVSQILKGGRHLLELIDEVLDLAKIEAGTLVVSPESVAPSAVAEECLAMVAERARETDVRLVDLSAGGDLPAVWADRVRFRQILLNLLSNAVKYNRPGGRVTLSQTITADGMVRISVADTGPGIAAKRQAELFKPFNRLGLESGDVEGTGIGLTITNSLVELLGGRIGFESEEGVGSTFWVDLPVVSRETADVGPSPVRKTAPAKRPRSNATRTVLYVEDNPANLDLIAEIVGHLPGTELVSARDAESALELAVERRPDLILMDVNLPGMNGYDALRALQEKAATRDIPVVAVSAVAMPADVKKGLDAGFVKYLTKPIDLNEIFEILEECGAVDS